MGIWSPQPKQVKPENKNKHGAFSSYSCSDQVKTLKAVLVCGEITSLLFYFYYMELIKIK